MSSAWTEEEVVAIVDDYFEMLKLELQGIPYKKSDHRNDLLRSVERSPGSIEYKHQNISAVLLDLSMPFIPGYKPAKNYQRKVLPDVVLDYLLKHPEIQSLMSKDVEAEANTPSVDDILKSLVEAPEPHIRQEKPTVLQQRPARRIDYLAREAANQSLGAAGEEFVLNYEAARLLHAGKDALADRIEQVSATVGDSAGYDIRSYDVDGTDRFIEVKTTRYGINTPFFLTTNELWFSDRNRDRYHLYRPFKFRKQPKLFTLPGFIGDNAKLAPQTYLARI